ncbi:fluoride efflux transporter FluC [uncultured Friedmanniella sp.]|uniref:fluoride efflux transporter FluC n=1 Tax=uncultured Friedmanniella sp. TaxID=335381 RepID=UPI0035C9B313
MSKPHDRAVTTDSHAELPLDPDVEAAETAGSRLRPVHLSARNIVLVATGGAIGTGLRLLLEQSVPRWAGVPVVTVVINVVGAFLLGALLETVANPELDERWSRRARLGFGTGVLGGFTTYSSLATDTAMLAGGGHPGPAVAYALVTVIVGLMASLGGIRAARAQSRHRAGALGAVEEQ